MRKACCRLQFRRLGVALRHFVPSEVHVQITARVKNAGSSHEVSVTTAGTTQCLSVPARSAGPGSSVNGGEFLMLALATCFCNDIYREAGRLKIPVDAVEVEARADFDGVGLTATNITYRARIASPAPNDAVATLLRETDAVAEVHNTVRAGVSVALVPWEAEGSVR
jgi:organic hydroperoxide reductase OsmC/OhrA